jgi:hypothetical protein
MDNPTDVKSMTEEENEQAKLSQPAPPNGTIRVTLVGREVAVSIKPLSGEHNDGESRNAG